MKHTAFSMATMALACMGLAVNAHASNDRHVVGKFTNSTSTVAGGVSTTLDLTVVNDIHNLSFPSHFIEWIQITAPTTVSGALVFTGSGANGAYTIGDFNVPSGWQVSSIAGAVITFNTTLTDFSAGQTRTFQIKVKTPEMLKTLAEYDGKELQVIGRMRDNGKYLLVIEIGYQGAAFEDPGKPGGM